MWEIIKDMVIYFILIMIVWTIAYGQIDDNAYRMKHLLHETVIEDLSTSIEPEGFSTVSARGHYMCKRYHCLYNIIVLGDTLIDVGAYAVWPACA